MDNHGDRQGQEGFDHITEQEVTQPTTDPHQERRVDDAEERKVHQVHGPGGSMEGKTHRESQT